MTVPETRPPSRHTIPLVLLGGILAVSTASIFIRFAQGEGVPSLVIAAARLTLASLVLAPYTLTRHRAELRGLSRRDLVLAILSGLFLAFHFAAWITSLQYTTVASSVVLVTTTPLWVAILSPLVLKEKVSRNTQVGMILALVGGIVVGVSDSCANLGGNFSCIFSPGLFTGKAFLGDLLSLVGAWMATGYMLAGRKLRVKMTLIPYITLVYSTSAVILIFMMAVMRISPIGFPPFLMKCRRVLRDWISLSTMLPRVTTAL